MKNLKPLLARACLAAAGAVAGTVASAQSWPQQPIRLVVPWSPGGATDVIARTLAVPLAQSLGQPVVVDNRPGAGGNIGTAQAAREKPDGYTLIMVTSSTHAANPHLYAKLPFDPAKDFAPVAFVASVPNVLVVPAASPFKTVRDLLERARRQPGKVSYGSAGTGSSQHLAGSMFEHAAAIDLLHVPYKGSGPAATDLMAGHIDLMLDTGSLPHVQAGTLRALAVASKARLPMLPAVPTFAEAGVSGMEASAWYGVMAPAGLPKDVAARLNGEIDKLLRNPAVVKRLQEFGAEVGGGTPDDFGRFAASELKRYAEIVRRTGARLE